MHDPDLHLFVDDIEVQHALDVTRVLNRPRQTHEPILIADRPWESGCRAQAWGSVLREPDGRFRMWYLIFNTAPEPGNERNGGYGYAESSDGIHWEKPELGIVEWRGSRANNLFFSFSPARSNALWYELAREGSGLPVTTSAGIRGVVNSMDGFTVLRDDRDPDPGRRYKLFANMQDHRMWAPWYRERYPAVSDEQVAAARAVFGQYMVTSPDGIHWAREPLYLVPAESGDYMMVLWDERNRRWLLNERPRALAGRNVGLRTSSDLAHWDEHPHPILMNGQDSGFGRLWEWHGGITPFNCGNLDLGLLEKWNNAGAFDTCELVSHRDGQPWRRVAPESPFLCTGPEGSFDRLLAYPTHNAPIRVGEELFIYYTGMGTLGKDSRDDTMAIGVAVVGLDRFAGYAHMRGPTGTIVTRPLEIRGNTLEVNVEPLRAPELRVAVRTTEWTDLPGYSLDECVPITSNGTRIRVTWKNRKSLEPLLRTNVVLHFSVKGAILYGYRVRGSP